MRTKPYNVVYQRGMTANCNTRSSMSPRFHGQRAPKTPLLSHQENAGVQHKTALMKLLHHAINGRTVLIWLSLLSLISGCVVRTDERRDNSDRVTITNTMPACPAVLRPGERLSVIVDCFISSTSSAYVLAYPVQKGSDVPVCERCEIPLLELRGPYMGRTCLWVTCHSEDYSDQLFAVIGSMDHGEPSDETASNRIDAYVEWRTGSRDKLFTSICIRYMDSIRYVINESQWNGMMRRYAVSNIIVLCLGAEPICPLSKKPYLITMAGTNVNVVCPNYNARNHPALQGGKPDDQDRQ